MPNKVKPKEQQIIEYKDNEEVAKAISRIGQLQREKTSIKTEIDEAISKLQTELAEKLAPIDQEISQITQSLYAWCELRKQHFFVKNKSYELPTGALAYRQNPPSVSGNVTKKKIEEILKRNSLTEVVKKFELKLAKVFLRMKLEVNKEAILQDPKKAKLITGLNVEAKEIFYVKPKETNIEVIL